MLASVFVHCMFQQDVPIYWSKTAWEDFYDIREKNFVDGDGITSIIVDKNDPVIST
jgi:hypothetical protein